MRKRQYLWEGDRIWEREKKKKRKLLWERGETQDFRKVVGNNLNNGKRKKRQSRSRRTLRQSSEVLFGGTRDKHWFKARREEQLNAQNMLAIRLEEESEEDRELPPCTICVASEERNAGEQSKERSFLLRWLERIIPAASRTLLPNKPHLHLSRSTSQAGFSADCDSYYLNSGGDGKRRFRCSLYHMKCICHEYECGCGKRKKGHGHREWCDVLCIGVSGKERTKKRANENAVK